MSGGRVRATILGFVGAFAVFALLFYVVGVDDLVSQLARADRQLVAAVCVATLAWLGAWSISLHTVLSTLGVSLSRIRAFLLLSGAMFANNVTPFGQAGGEPVTALLISRVTDAEYETGLAAIASVDTLNFVPSITLALFGVGYYATEFAVGRNVVFVGVAVTGLAVGVPAAVYVAWTHRYGLEHRVVRALTPLIQRAGRLLPRVSAPSAEAIERRINGFFAAIERIATDRRNVAVALAFSALGWFFQMVALYVAFQAIGSSISFALALFVVPLGAIAGITPLPGGAGGIEAVLVFLLVTATGPAIGAGTATAAVIIYRGAVYWIPIVLGGSVVGFLSVSGRA